MNEILPLFEGHCEAPIAFISVKTLLKVFLTIHSVSDVFKQENVTVLINIPQDWEIVWEQFEPERQVLMFQPYQKQSLRGLFNPHLFCFAACCEQ